MSETVKVTIDGAEYELPAGLTILQAAAKVGIDIPHFCWHKHLSISGNCRMCLVEVKPGPPKPQIACATPITDGMEVTTNSDRIKTIRNAVIEFLLINHPLDCPVCDEAYECKLQDYVYEYGPPVSRFVPFHDEKKTVKRKDMGKLFMEMNRCISCTRCVRYLNEVAGAYEMDRTGRGNDLKIDTYKKAFESNFLLNAADICPVGALEDRKFRFSARKWDLLRTPTVCPTCSIGCNIYIDSHEGLVKRLIPRENDDVNACWICDFGRHHFDFIGENRLETPQIRDGADLHDTSFELAFERIKNGVENVKTQHGPEAMAILASAQMTNEELYLAKKLAGLLGAGRFGFLAGHNRRKVVPVMSDILPRTLVSGDKTPNSTGGRLMKIHEGDEEFTYGHELLAAIENGKIRGLILFHEDLASLDNFDKTAVKKAMAMLDFLVVAAWRPTEIAAQAHLVLPTRTYAEKTGSFTNHWKRVQRIHPAVPGPYGILGEIEILTGIGRRFDPEFGFDSAKEAFGGLAAEEPAFKGLDWEDIGEKGVLVKETTNVE